MSAARRIVDINLLPASLRPTELTPKAGAITAALIVLIAALFPAGFLAAEQRDRADGTEARAAVAEDELAGRQVSIARERTARVALDDAQARLAVLEGERARLQGGRRPLATDIALIWGAASAPPDARVTAVTGTQTGLRVDGRADDPLAAIAFAEQLVAAGGFARAQMVAFVPGAAGGQFSIEVTR
jgi:hypothetical protein